MVPEVLGDKTPHEPHIEIKLTADPNITAGGECSWRETGTFFFVGTNVLMFDGEKAEEVNLA